MQSGDPIHVSVDVSNNNLTNDLQIPYITPTQTVSKVESNCLTFEDPTDDAQKKYMNNFLPGWNKQNVCDFPRISYSPTEKE